MIIYINRPRKKLQIINLFRDKKQGDGGVMIPTHAHLQNLWPPSLNVVLFFLPYPFPFMDPFSNFLFQAFCPSIFMLFPC